MPSCSEQPGYSITLRHYYTPSYFDTSDQLERAYRPVLDWLKDNIKTGYRIYEMDNTLYSDLNEDALIGYILVFDKKEDAVQFKLTWL